MPERITEIVRRLVSRAEAPTPLLDVSAELIHGRTVWSRGAGMAVALYACDEHMRAVRVEQEQQELRAQQAGRNAGDRADGGGRYAVWWADGAGSGPGPVPPVPVLPLLSQLEDSCGVRCCGGVTPRHSGAL